MDITQLLFLPFLPISNTARQQTSWLSSFWAWEGTTETSSCLYYLCFILWIWQGNQHEKPTTSLKFNFTSPKPSGTFEKQGEKSPDCNPKPLCNISAVKLGECVCMCGGGGGGGGCFLNIYFFVIFFPLRIIGNNLDQMIRSAWNMKILPSNPSYWLQE